MRQATSCLCCLDLPSTRELYPEPEAEIIPVSLELPSSGYSITATTRQLRPSLVMRPEESRILNGNGEALAFQSLAGGEQAGKGGGSGHWRPYLEPRRPEQLDVISHKIKGAVSGQTSCLTRCGRI